MALPAELADQVRRVAPIMLAGEQVLPVPEVFRDLLPGGGLQRGWTTRVEGSASARALGWALLGEITTAGRWVAAVDVGGISLAAAAELGVAIERVLVVDNVGPEVWPATIGALIGAVDVIVFDAPRHRIPPSDYRKIASRCRERGTVLMELGSSSSNRANRYRAEGQLQYDLSFSVEPTEWKGLGRGYGHLNARSLGVTVSGRRARGSRRQGHFELPNAEGFIRRLDGTGERPALAVVGE